MKTAIDIATNAKTYISGQKARSAWDKGVKEYALELIDCLRVNIHDGYIGIADICNPRELEKALLNGASDWKQYSDGGCALIYDGDIAKRLCNNTELKKTDSGRKEPNSRETWLDVQARALYQAARKVRDAIFTERIRDGKIVYDWR